MTSGPETEPTTNRFALSKSRLLGQEQHIQETTYLDGLCNRKSGRILDEMVTFTGNLQPTTKI